MKSVSRFSPAGGTMFARSLAARSFHFPSPCPVNNMLGAPKLARQTPLAIRPVVALIAPSTLISHSSMRSPTFLGGDVSFLAPTPSVAAFHSGVGAFEKAIVWDERVAAVNELLKQKTSFDFHERLQTEAEERPIICYDQLLDIAVSTGMTREEGAEVICAMQTAGIQRAPPVNILHQISCRYLFGFYCLRFNVNRGNALTAVNMVKG